MEYKISFQPRFGHAVAFHNKTLILQINCPEKANSLNVETCEAMSETMDEFETNSDLVCAILCAKGKNFCAGMDLTMVQANKRIELPKTGFGGLTARRLNKPIIGVIQGAAFGGGFELALACDILIATPQTKFCLPEPKVGQAALAGGLERLPIAIGQKRAMELILTSRVLYAEEARSYGLVNLICSPEALLQRALEIADQICDSAPLSLFASKAVALKHERGLMGYSTDPTNEIARMLDSQDAIEGALAFTNHRDPNWSGR